MADILSIWSERLLSAARGKVFDHEALKMELMDDERIKPLFFEEGGF